MRRGKIAKQYEEWNNNGGNFCELTSIKQKYNRFLCLYQPNGLFLQLNQVSKNN